MKPDNDVSETGFLLFLTKNYDTSITSIRFSPCIG
jgi:hypothetical protein